jgi:hypothetical protein
MAYRLGKTSEQVAVLRAAIDYLDSDCQYVIEMEETQSKPVKAEIYRNLHRGGFSIRSCRTGLVVGYTDDIVVRNAKLVVQPGGRRRAMEQRKRNVHAFVRGEITEIAEVAAEATASTTAEVTYNPFRNETFVRRDTGEPVTEAECIVLRGGKAYIGKA